MTFNVCIRSIKKKTNYGLNKDESVKGGKLVEEHFCTRCTVKHGFLPLVWEEHKSWFAAQGPLCGKCSLDKSTSGHWREATKGWEKKPDLGRKS